MDHNPLRIRSIYADLAQPRDEHDSKGDWVSFLAKLGLGAGAVALLSKKGNGPPQPGRTVATGNVSPSDGAPGLRTVAVTCIGATLASAVLEAFLDRYISEHPSSQFAAIPTVVPTVVNAPSVTEAQPSKQEEPLPPDLMWLRLAPCPCIVLIIGKRGSGKTGLGYRLLELNRHRAAPYVIGMPTSARQHLPDWIGVANTLEEVPHGAIVLIDEAYLRYHARGAMSADGRSISHLVNLSRQRQQTLIFVSQSSAHIDLTIVAQADVIAIKELSDISMDFERKELRRYTVRARPAFSTIGGDRQKWTWVYSESANFEGLVENQLPDFWTLALSRSFADAVGTPEGYTPRKGIKTSREDLMARARDLVDVRKHSYGQAAQIMGLPKSTVWDLVNPDPHPEN